LIVFFSQTKAQQKEGNVWFFGKNAGIDFNSSPPKALSVGAINTNEGCASISDKNGNLLFYTDGIKVYNRQHKLMTNGDSLKGFKSSTQSGIIVPNPGKPDIYYIFSASGYDSLYYSVVDISLSSGLGSVTQKNIGLMANGTEKLNAVKHRNRKDTWVVSHQRDNNQFYVFLVDANGVSLIPVISAVGSIYVSKSAGYLKFSPNGKKIVSAQFIASSSSVEILDFDDNTGKISNAEILISNSERYYGAEFSPTGNYLYLTKTSSTPNVLEQYYMRYNNIMAIRASKIVIDTMGSTLKPGALQLAPDGKIYMAYAGFSFLGVINNPEEQGHKCNFDKSGFSLIPGSISQFGLPSFNQSFFYKPKVDIKIVEPNCGSLNYVIGNIGDTSGIISSTWHFGDSTIATGLVIQKQYQKHGNYTLTNVLETKFGAVIFTDTLRRNIVTRPFPKANLVVNNSEQCSKNNSFLFIDSSTYFNGSSFQKSIWKVDDTLSVKNKVSLTQQTGKIGEYTVKLIVTSTDNCTDSVSTKITVKPTVEADFGTQNSQCLSGNNFAIAQLSTIAAPETIKGYLWRFGDNDSSTTIQPNKTYSDTGTFNIKMIAYASNGCNDTVEKQIRVLPMPEAIYTTDRGCSVDTITFQNTSKNSKTSQPTYLWHFGDSIIQNNAREVKYYFNKKGKHTVKLVAKNSYGCIDSASMLVNVYQKPNAAFRWEGNCIDNSVTLIDETQRFNIKAKENTWVLENGKQIKNDGAKSITTKYNKTGFTPVKLVVEDNNGCIDSITQQVYINPLPKVNFELGKLAQCLKGNRFLASNLTTISEGKVSKYNWLVSDVSVGNNVYLSTSINAWGKHNIKLIAISDSLCADSLGQQVEVYPQNNLDIQVNKANQCERNNRFEFTNNSWIPTGTANYIWELSNGDSYKGENIAPLSFTIRGRYLMKVFSETDKGCKDTTEMILKILFNPTVNFEVEDICSNKSAYFINTSQYTGGNNGKWLWLLGDGNTSNQKEPIHKYLAEGYYDVTLIGVSAEGCSDTLKRDSALKVLPSPQANFKVVSNKNINNTIHLEFENQTKFANIFYWTFGNGKFSPEKNTKTTYYDTGKYKISLYAENDNKCTDFYDTIIHFKPEVDFLIPNAFSPNKDPLNKTFKIEGSYYYREFEMEIFDRWGTQVFRANDPGNGWDGKYDDKLLPDGVYLYSIRMIGTDDKLHIYKGSVTLLR
jgi:gliding motility-associated-like protein